MTQSPNSSGQPSSSSPNPALQGWVISIFCTLITTAGAIYTGYSSQKTQSAIESVKTDSEQQITKIKSDTEKEIKLAELRSQEKILLLKNQFEAEKELRAKTAANESTAHSIRVATCDEIRKIRDSMSTDIPAIRFNDYRIDDALTSLQAADNKRDSYLTEVGLLALRAALPKKISEDFRTAKREYYSAVLQGYNAEFRTSCAK